MKTRIRRSGLMELARCAAFSLEPIEQRVLMASISGAVFNDYDADFVRDANEPGLANWAVYLDENNNGAFDGIQATRPSTDTPLAMPDDRTTRYSNLTVSGIGGISDLNVSLDITHTFDGDLDIYLISPVGTRVELTTDNGAGTDGMNVTLDDEAAASVTSWPTTSGVGPVTGSWRPEGLLSSFDGQSADGLWRLEWTDDAGGDSGTLNAWSLSFSAGEQLRYSAADGSFSFTGLAAGSHVLRQVSQGGYSQTGPAGGFHTINLVDAGSAQTGANFGNRLPPGTISGTVFGDYNANGARDPGEPGLAGWTVYLDIDNDSILDATETSITTSADGSYTLLNVPPGTYKLREVLQSGYVQTTPGPGGVALRDSANPTSAISASEPGQKYSPTEVLVRVNNSRGLRELDRYTRANPGAVVSSMIDPASSSQLFRLEGDSVVEVKLQNGVDPLKAIAALGALSLVQYAEPNVVIERDPRELTPNDPQYPSQYHHPLMQSNTAWDTTVGDPRVKIGVTDDGVALSHPDLYQNIWVNPGEIPTTRNANLTDINGDGYISMLELNDPVNIGPFKVNDTNLDGRIDWIDLTAVMGGGGVDDGTGGWTNGIDEGGNGFADDIVGRDFWSNDNNANPDNSSDDHGSHVSGIAAARTNNAVGVSGVAGGATIVPIRFYSSTGGSWTASHVLSAYTYAANNGIRILSTSYNVDGFVGMQTFRDALTVMYNAGVLHFNSAGNNGQLNPVRQQYDTSLYVVNTDSADARNSSSNYGWGVDVSAPGTNILSTTLGSTLTTYTYENFTGTSMATPAAAGVAALIWSAHPTWTREQVAATLIGQANNIDALQTAAVNGLVGSGRVNSNRSVNLTLAPPKFKNTANTPLFNGLPAENASSNTAPTAFTMDVASVFDPSTMIAGNFELRGDGFDDTFGTADDVLIPFTLRFGDVAAPAHPYQIGTNRLFFTITGAMGADKYRFSAKPTLTDPFGNALDGNGDGTGGDAATRTFSIVGITNPYTVAVDSGVDVVGAVFGNKDNSRPTTAGSFEYETAERINFLFNEDVGGSLAAADLTLTRTSPSGTIPTGDLTLAYNSLTNNAAFTYSGTPSGILPDGNYTATLAAAGVADPYGNTLAADATFGFFVLAGDANRDRVVNLDDFTTLAANFGESRRVFSEGDFDLSSNVDLDDFTILASQFGKSLPAARAASSSVAAAAAKAGAGGAFSESLVSPPIRDDLFAVASGTVLA